MGSEILNINKNNILDLNKKPQRIYDILKADKVTKKTEKLRIVESYFKECIEKNISSRNNIGLTFLAIKNEVLLYNKLDVEILLEFLLQKGFKSYVNKRDNGSTICIEWGQDINMDGVKMESYICDRLQKEFGLLSIPAVKKIENYIYEEILPLIRKEANNNKINISIELPEGLKSLSCQKILFEIFKKNGIQCLINPSNSNSIALLWEEELPSTYSDNICSLDGYERIIYKCRLSQLNIDVNELIVLSGSSGATRIYSHRRKANNIKSKRTVLNKFYFDDIDLNNFNTISKPSIEENLDLDANNSRDSISETMATGDSNNNDSSKVYNNTQNVFIKLGLVFLGITMLLFINTYFIK